MPSCSVCSCYFCEGLVPGATIQSKIKFVNLSRIRSNISFPVWQKPGYKQAKARYKVEGVMDKSENMTSFLVLLILFSYYVHIMFHIYSRMIVRKKKCEKKQSTVWAWNKFGLFRPINMPSLHPPRPHWHRPVQRVGDLSTRAF